MLFSMEANQKCIKKIAFLVSFALCLVSFGVEGLASCFSLSTSAV